MIKFENVEVTGWEHAIRGMRNPMNSWDKSEGDYRKVLSTRCDACIHYISSEWDACDECEYNKLMIQHGHGFMIGPNDMNLMMRLRNAGTDHRKFMRMITVYVDITAPLYWWKEFDTYKVGTVANSCSTMHTIHRREFIMNDFSLEHLFHVLSPELNIGALYKKECDPTWVLKTTIDCLNFYRKIYLETKEKKYWQQIIQLLPSSYNQKRTVMMNYEVLANIYKGRKNHKLDEWSVGFMEFINGLPYSNLITGGE